MRDQAPVGSASRPLGETNANVDRLKELHATLLRVRSCELALAKLFADGEVPGFIHLSLGQEAVAAGVCSALGVKDTLATTHRGHGHVIARGVDLEGFFKELMGRAGGRCGGRAGSMHVADIGLGILGANGIVGASVPLALGSALAHQTRATGGIAVAFFGDGAMAEGSFHESLNMASLWKLPLLLICENNGWSEFSPTERQFSGTLEGLGRAFNVAYRRVDGNDVEETASAAEDAVAYVRGQGPFLMECVTTRVRGHFEGDAQKYRSEAELRQLGEVDPIARSAARLAELSVAASEMQAMAQEIDRAVAAATEAAHADRLPDFESAIGQVYTRSGVA